MIELQHVSRLYGRQTALRGVSLKVPEGSFTALLGPSGCGKTTSLRIMAGLDQPTRGQVLMRGRDVVDLTPAERNVAMVFQSFALYPHMTVADNIALPLAMRSLNRIERMPMMGWIWPKVRDQVQANRERVRDIAGMLAIGDLLDRKPGTLSGGQKQRVAVARALVREPDAFLLDEPLSNLDAKLRVQMRGELIDLHRRTGRTFVYVTHDQAEAMSMADQVIVMMGGEVVQSGTPRDLYERPVSTDVAAFLGDHPINWLDLDVSSDGTLTALPGVALVGGSRPAQVRIGLRPESLDVSDDGPLAGRVERVEYLGSKLLIAARTPQDDQLRAAVSPNAPRVDPGDRIRFTFDRSAAQIFDAQSGARLDLSLLASTPRRSEAVPGSAS